MKIWFIPSWNGDLRLEADGDKTKLSIVKPTPSEVEALEAMKKVFLEREWINEADWKNPSSWRKRENTINAPLSDVGVVASKILRPGEAVMTAISYADGKVTTHMGSESELQAAVAEASSAGAEAAATVKRPTPSCPECFIDAIGPATEVLLTFLTPEQHATWAKDRTMLVVGGLTGTQYLLAHRNSETAQRIGRICYDVDAQAVVHFHDRTVPPEEEVLAAKLILESEHEDWLRNEATMIAVVNGVQFFMPEGLKAPVFKNPFGDIMDGVADAQLAAGYGLHELFTR